MVLTIGFFNISRNSVSDRCMIVHKDCLRIRFCRTQTRCLRGAPRCRRGRESDNTNAGTPMSQYLVDTSPHTHKYIYRSHAGPYLVVTGPTHKRIDPLSRAFASYHYCHVPRLYRLSDWPREVKNDSTPRYRDNFVVNYSVKDNQVYVPEGKKRPRSLRSLGLASK